MFKLRARILFAPLRSRGSCIPECKRNSEALCTLDLDVTCTFIDMGRIIKLHTDSNLRRNSFKPVLTSCRRSTSILLTVYTVLHGVPDRRMMVVILQISIIIGTTTMLWCPMFVFPCGIATIFENLDELFASNHILISQWGHAFTMWHCFSGQTSAM